eukprot:gnl/Trimastix_PCT/70.p1 GENE.gnl/Trimastix_PCT/70~~gnl/Trimastix_PCT/70.p1  ORF type:complete len:127 (-),score=44.45 gnl/Trimastix_PCT/70:94-474(-)
MSEDLIWSLVRRHNCFQKKVGGHIFSTEKGNLTGVNTKRYSGLANKKVVDVDIKIKGHKKRIVLSKKKPGTAQRKPAKMFWSQTYRPNDKLASRIALEVATTQYRPDLRKAACKRAKMLLKAARKN